MIHTRCGTQFECRLMAKFVQMVGTEVAFNIMAVTLSSHLIMIVVFTLNVKILFGPVTFFSRALRNVFLKPKVSDDNVVEMQ